MGGSHPTTLKRFARIGQTFENKSRGFHAAIDKYKKECVKKSSNWFILNREHAEFVINGKVEDFAQIYCPEEHYFATTVLNEFKDNLVLTKNKPEMGTTFANWSDGDYIWLSKSNLKTYYEIEEDELLYLLKSPCLFGRKFAKNCKVKNKKNLREYLKNLV